MTSYTLKYAKGKCETYIAAFPGGVPNGACFEEDGPQTLKWSLQANTGKRPQQQMQRILTAENNVMEYVGRNYGEDSNRAKSMKYLVGVVSKKDGTVTLYDSPSMAMKQRVKRTRYSDAEESNQNKEVEDNQNESQFIKDMKLKRELTESFGARKSKLMLQTAIDSRVDDAQLRRVEAQLTQRMEEQASSAPTLEETKMQMDSERALPPFDMKATEPEDVYPFHQLIPKEEYELLKHDSKKLANATEEEIKNWKDTKTFGEYVLSHISALPRDNPVKKNKMARALLYIHYLQTFMRCARREIRRDDDRLEDIPSPIVNRMFSLFSDANMTAAEQNVVAVRPKHRSKMQTYIIALALHVDDFTINISPFITDFKMSAPDVRKVMNSMALKVAGNLAKLVAPIKFPEINLRKARK